MPEQEEGNGISNAAMAENTDEGSCTGDSTSTAPTTAPEMPISVAGEKSEPSAEAQNVPHVVKNGETQQSEGEEVESSTNENSLPEELLRKVFQQLDKVSLIKCRVVCKSWKSAVDNSPDLMRCLVFDVLGVHQFLDSTIANKAKKICFQIGLRGDLDLFFDAIRGSVESISLDFLERPHASQHYLMERYQQQATNLRGALMSCENLSSLKFASSNRKFLRFLHDLTGQELFNIRHLIVNIQDITDEEVEWLRIFVSKCILLNSLEYYYEKIPPRCDNDDRAFQIELRLINIAIEHINNYPGSLRTMRFMCATFISHGVDSVRKSELMAAAIRNNLEIDFGSMWFDIGNVLDLRREGVYLTTENCRSLKNGFTSWENRVTRSDAGAFSCFSHLNYLVLSITRYTSEEDLDLLRRLTGLRKLQLYNTVSEFELQGFSEHAFSFGLPNLTSLYLTGDTFSSAELSFNSLHLWFPNLKEIMLSRLKIIPSQVFVDFSKLGLLTNLIFKDSSITDYNFIRPCEVPGRDPQAKKLIVPAIAALTSLKKLTLANCQFLTDICLASGIERCTGLKYLRLESSGKRINQFTELGRTTITNAGILKLRQYVGNENSKTFVFLPA